ncbi:hypothetical protein KIPB_011763, partial [Kipferlia bialata]|eukprot:g11763.t1
MVMVYRHGLTVEGMRESGWKISGQQEDVTTTGHVHIEDPSIDWSVQTKEQCYASLTYSNGDVYTGYIVDGLPSGFGTLLCDSGDTYKGE